MRYYNFALPLLLLIAATQLSSNAVHSSITSRAAIAIPIGIAIFYAILTRMAPYTPNLVDSPELRGFISHVAMFYLMAAMSCLALAVWVYADRAGTKVFLYIFMPLSVVVASLHINHELRQRLIPDVFDRAGIFAKQYLPDADIAKTVIVGSEEAGLFRALFYLDDPRASLKAIPKGAPVDLAALPARTEWVLVIGDHSLSQAAFYQLSMSGFALSRVTESNRVDFRRNSWPGVISSVRGLSSSEPWGTWSLGNAITLEFLQPLPLRFRVRLIAHAFGPNVGKEFIVRVGNSSKRLVLGVSDEEKVVELDNPNRSKIIEIVVPSPISPKELGLSGDERALGVALIELSVEPL